MIESAKRTSSLRRHGARVWLCAGALLLSGALALAQESGAPPPAAPQAQPEQPEQQTTARPPGLLETLGRWFDDSVAGIGAGIKNSQERIGDTTGAAKGAVDAVGRLGTMRVVDGRARCELAANGAPDCIAAATTICRGKGFESGKSVNVESAQKCSARALLMGRRSSDAECAVETFVTRAMCQ